MTVRAPIHDLHAANLLTYAALAGAVITILGHGRRDFIAVGLSLAIVADTFDGRFARLFARTTREARVGSQLDSLVDAITFGLTPVAALAAVNSPAGWNVLPWGLVAVLYVAAVVTRLAFFNLACEDTVFTGLPAPAAALICAAALAVPCPAWIRWWPLAAGAAAMVAPVRLPRPGLLGSLAFAASAVGVAWLLIATA